MKIDAHTDLFRDERNAVTRSWILLNGMQYAVRYVDQTSQAGSEPPRGTAMSALFACLLLAGVVLVQILFNDFPRSIGWVLLVACAAVILVGGYFAFAAPSVYVVNVRFKNGEQIQYQTGVASKAGQFQEAIRLALDGLDYHDTDAAKPTVVLASVEPATLTAISGSEPEVVRVDEVVLKNSTKLGAPE